MQYYVCYFNEMCELISLGPHHFIDKEDYQPEEGFFNKNEAEIMMEFFQKERYERVFILPRLAPDAMERRKETLEAIERAKRDSKATHEFSYADTRDEYDRDYWRKDYSDRF